MVWGRIECSFIFSVLADDLFINSKSYDTKDITSQFALLSEFLLNFSFDYYDDWQFDNFDKTIIYKHRFL